MNINPQLLPGHWKEGYALDLHTLSSTPKEWESTRKITHIEIIDGKPVPVQIEIPDKVTKWDTVYTPIGEEMNHLKYWNQIHRAKLIAQCAADFLLSKMPVWKIDLIIPIPPSDTTRPFQPVNEIVNHLCRLCNLPADFNSLKKLKSTAQLKQIESPAERKEILKNAFAVHPPTLWSKNVLLFDDLYRSGSTLNAACDIIQNQASAKAVYVLTITKTRSKR